jgi:hypothetical protein
MDDSESVEGQVFEQALNAALIDDNVPAFANAAMPGDKPTAREALNRPQSEEWQNSMQAELDALRRKEVYDGPMEAPRGANVVRSQWVLKKKRDENNEVKSLKSQIVAGRNTQVYGVDYNETSLPTIHLSTLRFLMAFAAKHGYAMESIDFDNAYLNSNLDIAIYMRQPPGFEVPGKEQWVLHLKKALYGLKQAG